MVEIIAKFKALSDNNRMRIVAALSTHDELCACQITELLQVTGATVSRHLTILSSSGIIENRKSGRWVFFRLKKGGIPAVVLAWLKAELSESTDYKLDLKALKKITASEPEEICRKQRGADCC